MDVVDSVVLKQLDFLTQHMASEAIKMRIVNSTDIIISSWEEDRKSSIVVVLGLHTVESINRLLKLW